MSDLLPVVGGPEHGHAWPPTAGGIYWTIEVDETGPEPMFTQVSYRATRVGWPVPFQQGQSPEVLVYLHPSVGADPAQHLVLDAVRRAASVRGRRVNASGQPAVAEPEEPRCSAPHPDGLDYGHPAVTVTCMLVEHGDDELHGAVVNAAWVGWR